jgi:hypothetical protein
VVLSGVLADFGSLGFQLSQISIFKVETAGHFVCCPGHVRDMSGTCPGHVRDIPGSGRPVAEIVRRESNLVRARHWSTSCKRDQPKFPHQPISCHVRVVKNKYPEFDTLSLSPQGTWRLSNARTERLKRKRENKAEN